MLQRSKAVIVVAIATIASAVTACAGGDPAACQTGSQCESGVCLADGTCLPAPDGGTNPGTDGGDDSDGATTNTCSPNHDGVISRDEAPLAPGRTATFRVALDVPVDTAGQPGTGGARVWDFSTAKSGDTDVESKLEAIDGTWFADSFIGASYYTRLSQTEELLGVFELTDTALLLRGVVSPSGGLARTELVYDPPVTVMKLPLSGSSSWDETTTVSGFASGVAAYYTERYQSSVDASGDLVTPYGTFPVLRVRTELTRTVGAAVTTKRSFLFVSECFTTVASVTSKDYESTVEFDQAAELRRLAP
jgi:hypothetical protein